VQVKIFPILIVYIQFVHKKEEDRQSLFITREKTTPPFKKKNEIKFSVDLHHCCDSIMFIFF
jgi:hypothetical protein